MNTDLIFSRSQLQVADNPVNIVDIVINALTLGHLGYFYAHWPLGGVHRTHTHTHTFPYLYYWSQIDKLGMYVKVYYTNYLRICTIMYYMWLICLPWLPCHPRILLILWTNCKKVKKKNTPSPMFIILITDGQIWYVFVCQLLPSKLPFYIIFG